MKLFVTGAGGFVGAEVVRQAVLAGHGVVGTVRPGKVVARLAPLSGKYNLVDVDLRDHDAVKRVLAEERPDVIVHLAWSGVANKARFDELQIEDNIAAACSLVKAGIACGAKKFVGLGSQGEYGPLNRRISETDLLQPTTLYGAAKVAVCHLTKQLAAQGGQQFAWMRLFSSYGPDDGPDWLIPSIIEEMLAGRRPCTTLGTQHWDYLYVEDVARAILAVATTSSAIGIFNLGSGEPVEVRKIVTRIRDLVAPDMELIFGEIPFRPGQVMHMEADVTRLKQATGWQPQVSIDAGLAKTVAWHKERRAKMSPSA